MPIWPTLAEGHIPYLGSWDQNFPGIILIHAAQILVSGHSQLAFHIFDILLQLVGSYLLIRIGERLYDIRAGMLAAVLAALYYIQQGLWMAGERDTYVSIMLLAAFYLALDRKRPFGVGALCSLAFLFRPTYAPYAVIFFVWYLIPADERRKVWPYIFGSTLPIILTIILYAAFGGLKDFWDTTILFNLKVYGGAGASFNFWEPIRFYVISLIPFAVATYYLWMKVTNRAVSLGRALCRECAFAFNAVPG